MKCAERYFESANKPSQLVGDTPLVNWWVCSAVLFVGCTTVE